MPPEQLPALLGLAYDPLVSCCLSPDGGAQERDKAVALIRETFPGAPVDVKGGGGSQVTISVGTTKIVSVNQRDLFRKYGCAFEELVYPLSVCSMLFEAYYYLRLLRGAHSQLTTN